MVKQIFKLQYLTDDSEGGSIEVFNKIRMKVSKLQFIFEYSELWLSYNYKDLLHDKKYLQEQEMCISLLEFIYL